MVPVALRDRPSPGVTCTLPPLAMAEAISALLSSGRHFRSFWVSASRQKRLRLPASPDWRRAAGTSPGLWAGHSGSQRNYRVIWPGSPRSTPAVINCGQVGMFRAVLGANEIEDYAAVAGDC